MLLQILGAYRFTFISKYDSCLLYCKRLLTFPCKDVSLTFLLQAFILLSFFILIGSKKLCFSTLYALNKVSFRSLAYCFSLKYCKICIFLEINEGRGTKGQGERMFFIYDGEWICEVPDSCENSLNSHLTLLDLGLLQFVMSLHPRSVSIMNDTNHFKGLFMELDPCRSIQCKNIHVYFPIYLPHFMYIFSLSYF